MKSKDIDWSSIDWSRKRVDIARELNIHPTLLSRNAKRLGIPKLAPGNPNRGRPSKIDWSAVDWRKSNRQLATELGFSFTTIAQRRGTQGTPRKRETSLLDSLDVGGGSIKRLLEAMKPGSSLWFPGAFKSTMRSNVSACSLREVLKITTWRAFENRGKRSEEVIRIEYPEP